jgi:hypothetical protein
MQYRDAVKLVQQYAVAECKMMDAAREMIAVTVELQDGVLPDLMPGMIDEVSDSWGHFRKALDDHFQDDGIAHDLQEVYNSAKAVYYSPSRQIMEMMNV